MINLKLETESEFNPETLKAKIIAENETTMSLEAQTAEQEIKAALSRTGTKGDHSKPGEPPYQITGNLVRAIKAEVETSGDGTAIMLGDTGGDAPYASMLEYGTAKTQPRPFLWSAFLKMTDRIKSAMGKLYG